MPFQFNAENWSDVQERINTVLGTAYDVSPAFANAVAARSFTEEIIRATVQGDADTDRAMRDMLLANDPDDSRAGVLKEAINTRADGWPDDITPIP